MDKEEKQYEENKKLLDELQNEMLYTTSTSNKYVKEALKFEKNLNRKDLHPKQQYFDIDVF